MSHRSTEQLAKAETDLMERVKAVRAEIRQRKAKEMTKLAMSYAKTISAAAKASGGEIPSPEQLAAMLSAKPSRKAKAGPKPKPAAKRPRRKLAPPAAPSA